MKSNVIRLSLASLMALALAIVLLPAYSIRASAQTITLKWAHPISRTSMNGEALEWAANEIEKRTGGKVKITHYWGGSLVSYNDILDGTRTAVADIGSVFITATPAKLPLANVSTLPLAVGDPLRMAMVQRELYQIPAIKAELQQHNQFYWLPNIWPPSTLCTKFPVTSSADLKGKRIRGYGYIMQFLERLGAVGVSMPGDQTYTALEKGTLEGAFAPTNNHMARKYNEVAPYMLMHALAYDLDGITTINSDTWKKLSPDVQKVFLDVAAEFPKVIADFSLKTATKDLVDLKAGRMQYTYLTPQARAQWAQEAAKMWGNWVTDMNSKNISNAKAVFDAYQGLLAKNGIKVGEHKGLPGIKGGEAL